MEFGITFVVVGDYNNYVVKNISAKLEWISMKKKHFVVVLNRIN